jgi:hypothetical protein
MIRAIETNYKGYRFRSRTEARWAVFFDALDIRWEYEKEGYELPSGRYLPDFYLPCYGPLGYWIEIKGNPPTTNELELLTELCDVNEEAGYLLCGTPGDACRWWSISRRNTFKGRAIGECAQEVTAHIRYAFFIEQCSPYGEGYWRDYFRHVDRAFEASRSARFEFGESGAA